MAFTTRARLGVLAIAAVAALSACSSDPTDASPSAGDPLVITDAWVKTADSGMTAAFAEVSNPGDKDVTIVSAASPSSTELQLHETVDGMMRQKEGGFVIPAGGSMTLEPGGNHIMFMDVPKPIVAGEDVAVTIAFSDGSSQTFTAVGKDYTGADEEYDDGSMDGMNMGDSMSPSPSS
jgi:copper(I)-binding protein